MQAVRIENRLSLHSVWDFTFKTSGSLSFGKVDHFQSGQHGSLSFGISSQAPVLKAKDITKGGLYIHVGGWEDEYGVALKANKIVCDDWEASKHRTQTICRMYKEGIITDESIYANLVDLVSGKKKGRENDEEFIYFNSVGLSYIDLNFSYYIYKEAELKGLGLIANLTKSNLVDYKSFIM